MRSRTLPPNLKATLGILVALLFPSGASAATGDGRSSLPPTWDGTVWTSHYPSERVANNPMLDRLYLFAVGFWAKRGVVPCGPVSILLSDQMNGANGAASSPKRPGMEYAACRLWVDTYLVRDAQRNSSLEDRVCNTVLHEVGHLGGLPHSRDGVMRPVDSIVGGFSIDDRGRWRGAGPCGNYVANRHNAKLKLKLNRRQARADAKRKMRGA